MSKIALDRLGHSYLENPSKESDWVLQEVNMQWSDGGAYALLGPSGCGKTTMLNIISGLVKPSQGKVFFDNKEITHIPTEQRNIAQIFQFPVIYDTMTVYDNLAFPLRNRGVGKVEIASRVNKIAELIELTHILTNKASGLTSSIKQKISLGRGLMRTDVNAILLDEPLTVIDPQQKWVLRSKLKELHQRLNLTMIYVTHDQTEALTFADQVVVMHFGKVLQIGTPVELFEKPKHTFVGYFVGSPGMNILPCNVKDEQIFLGNFPLKDFRVTIPSFVQKLEIGIRPEYIKFSDRGLPVDIIKRTYAGGHQIITTQFKHHRIKLIVKEYENVPQEKSYLDFDKNKSYLFGDDWLIE